MAAHVWLRIASSPTLDLDEAEQIVLSQSLRVGYGTQAPLFTWLQTLTIRTMGLGVLPIALLKSALLVGIFAAGYAIAARLVRDPGHRAPAAASLFLLPYLVYQSLRDSSHSIILTLACALSLLLILRLADRRDTLGYVALGICVAAGCLSKYNFALFLVPAAIATVAVPEFRPVARDPRLLMAAAIALALFAPHGLWLANNFDAATAESIEKLKPKDFSAFRSLAKLLECLVRFSAVALAAFTVASPRIWLRRSPGEIPRATSRWFAWFFGCGLLGLSSMMIATRATDLSERWLLPLLFCLPIALYHRAMELAPAAERRLAWCIGIAAISVPIALAAHVQFGPALHHPLRKNVDFTPLACARETPAAPRTIIAQNYFLGGNLKLLYPNARVFVPSPCAPPGKIVGPTWLVWQSKSSGFRRAATTLTGVPWEHLRPQTVALPYFHSGGTDAVLISTATLP